MSSVPTDRSAIASVLEHLPKNAAIDTMHQSMAKDGAIVIEQLLDAATVDAINRELDPVMSGPNHGLRDAGIVGAGKRLNSSLRHCPTIATKVAANEVLVGVAGSFLLEHCDTLQLGATHVADVMPGEPEQALHRDDFNWGHIKGRSHPLSITTIIALDEFTPVTGSTRVIAGSHQWDDAYKASSARQKWRDGVYAEMVYPAGSLDHLADQPVMQPGTAVTVLGTTVHGAGANRSTDQRRRALVIQYCVGWIRATHANHLLYPPDIAKTLPEAVQRLLGYQLEAKHCGQLEQGVDPITLLRD